MISPMELQGALEGLRSILAEGQRRARQLHRPVLVSLAQPLAHLPDSVQLFAAASRIRGGRTFWAQPIDDFWMVGAGQAAEIRVSGDDRFHQAIAAHREMMDSAVIEAPDRAGAGPVFVGGFRFDLHSAESLEWQGFPDGLLTLPEWAVSQSGEEGWVTINVMIYGSSDTDAVVAQLKAHGEVLQEPVGEVRWSETEIVPDGVASARWLEGVAQAIDDIKGGHLRKVTLAHTLRLLSPEPLRREAVLQRLIIEQPQCRIFAIDREDSCFLGATPEQLVSLHEGAVRATCLAGSSRRGESAEEDTALEQSLLQSDKERWEHAIVVEWVAEHLSKLCDDLHWNDPPQLIKLSSVQHLATTFTGRPASNRHVLDYVAALHPTPAVGGVPLKPALETIRRLEERERGWYSGPVGWVDRHGHGEFGVAIRSALLYGNEALLYAGAGIVSGSDLDSEFLETSMKFKPLLSAIGMG